MEPERVDHENVEETEEDDQFLGDDEVYLEVADDGDAPMDEDDGQQQQQYAEGEELGEDDEIVYGDNSIQHFPNHRQSVFAVAAHPSAPLIASGGAGTTADFVRAADAGADAVLAASVFHFGTLTVAEVKTALAEAGHPVRPVPQPAG